MFVLNVSVARQHRILDILRAPKGRGRQNARGRCSAQGAENEVWIQIMNVFIRAMVRIFSFGERWNVLFNSAIALLNRTFCLSPHENIRTIALINIYYLYII